jgi:hypothetical protein
MQLKMLIVSVLLASATSAAEEGLESFSGSWRGNGEYVRLNGNRVNVKCTLETNVRAASLNMNGHCTALVFITQDLSATIEAEGSSITGRYSGPEGVGAVIGERAGKTLDLTVNWEEPVRGDESSEMKIELIGDNQLRLRTFDLDPASNSVTAVTDLDLYGQ